MSNVPKYVEIGIEEFNSKFLTVKHNSPYYVIPLYNFFDCDEKINAPNRCIAKLKDGSIYYTLSSQDLKVWNYRAKGNWSTEDIREDIKDTTKAWFRNLSEEAKKRVSKNDLKSLLKAMEDVVISSIRDINKD